MPIRVYAVTSIYGGVFDQGIDAPSGKFFAQVKTGRFRLVVFPVVVDELQDAPERVRQVSCVSLGELSQQKQVVMHDLLTGRVRVNHSKT